MEIIFKKEDGCSFEEASMDIEEEKQEETMDENDDDEMVDDDEDDEMVDDDEDDGKRPQ